MAPLVRTMAFTVVVPGTVAGLIPWALLALEPSAWRLGAAVLGWLGSVPIAFGVWLYAWCAWRFATAGRGTPSPHDPPRELVTTGPYARSRNPMYVAVVAVVIGLAVANGSAVLLAYALVLAASFHRRVVRFEEPVLARERARDPAQGLSSASSKAVRTARGQEGQVGVTKAWSS